MSLSDYWYIACESATLAARPLAVSLLGQPLVLFARKTGEPWRCSIAVRTATYRCRDERSEQRFELMM